MIKLMTTLDALLGYNEKGPFAIKTTEAGKPYLLIADTKIMVKIPAPELQAKVDGMIPFPKKGTAKLVTAVTPAGFETDEGTVEGHAVATELTKAMGIYNRMQGAATTCTVELDKSKFSPQSKLEIAGQADKIVVREKDKWVVHSGNMSRMYGFEANSDYINAFYCESPTATMELKEASDPAYCFIHIADSGLDVYFLAPVMLEAKMKLALKTEEKPAVKPEGAPATVKKETPVETPKAQKAQKPVTPPTPVVPVAPVTEISDEAARTGTVADVPEGAESLSGPGAPVTEDPATPPAVAKPVPELLSPEDIFSKLQGLAEQAKAHEEVAVGDRRQITELVKTIRRSLNVLLKGGGDANKLDELEKEVVRLKGELNKYNELKKVLGKLN